MKNVMTICAIALMVASAQAVTVDIYSGHTQVDGGAPYSDLEMSFEAPDIMFGVNTGNAWFPLGDYVDFGAEITGCLLVEADDIYEFGLNSDDGSMLYIDDVLVVDNGDGHAPQLIYDVTFLTAGFHSFKVEFFEDFGGASGLDMYLPTGVTYAPCQVVLAVDIKPGSCPNPLNVNSNGVLPVAILGMEDFDVSDIDVGSVRLEGVAPIRFDYEDVATPFGGELCDCHEEGADGYLDLTLKFDTQEIAAALGPVTDGEDLELILTCELIDGTSLQGSDCIRIIKKGKN